MRLKFDEVGAVEFDYAGVADRDLFQSGVNIPLDIAEFHEKFGLTYDGPPRWTEQEFQDFREDFICEEFTEYMDAVQAKDMAKAFDALLDLVYVAVGTAYSHGFPFAEGWRRVHAANMAKVRCERAEDSLRGTTYDIIKPAGWVAPDLSDLVQVHQTNEDVLVSLKKIGEVHSSDPVERRGDEWWHWDETWSQEYGPFPTEEDARMALKTYCEENL